MSEGRSAPDAYGVTVWMGVLILSCWGVARWMSAGAVTFVSGWVLCSGAVWSLAAIGDSVLQRRRRAKWAEHV